MMDMRDKQPLDTQAQDWPRLEAVARIVRGSVDLGSLRLVPRPRFGECSAQILGLIKSRCGSLPAPPER